MNEIAFFITPIYIFFSVVLVCSQILQNSNKFSIYSSFLFIVPLVRGERELSLSLSQTSLP